MDTWKNNNLLNEKNSNNSREVAIVNDSFAEILYNLSKILSLETNYIDEKTKSILKNIYHELDLLVDNNQYYY